VLAQASHNPRDQAICKGRDNPETRASSLSADGNASYQIGSTVADPLFAELPIAG
jgi:hypothetical protein